MRYAGCTVSLSLHYAEAVKRAEFEVGLFHTQIVGATAALHEWDKHAPAPAGGVPALAQAALSPSPQSCPEVCTCIT